MRNGALIFGAALLVAPAFAQINRAEKAGR
jgi:hypothetical protein